MPYPKRGAMPDYLRHLHRRIWTLLSLEQGQAMPEYALVIALVALVAIVALQLLGGGLQHIFNAAGAGI